MRINPDPDGERRDEALRRLGRAPPPEADEDFDDDDLLEPTPRRARSWRRFFLWLLLLWLALTLGPVLVWRSLDPPLSAFMLHDWVKALLAHRANFTVKHRHVPLAQIALPMRAAVVAAEDQRFLTHHGFDFRAIQAALNEARRSGEVSRGGSTLTQQLAKNLFLWSDRQWLRKGLEAWYTLLLEATWTKPRILEVYLNVVQFGDGIYGVEAASRTFFGHPAASLSSPEAALLAAVLPNPLVYKVEAPTAYVRARQRWILGQMGQ